MGARVIACASSDEKCAFAKQHGADETINYGTADLQGRAEGGSAGGRGVDVIYDPVGGPYAESALRAIAWKGRFLVVGFAAGEIPKLPLNLPLLKGCDVVGVLLGRLHRDASRQAQAANMAQIVPGARKANSRRMCTRSIRSPTRQALKDIAARKVMGKAILRP